MTHPRAVELVRRLRTDGNDRADPLADEIERAATAYRCPACDYDAGDPIVAMVNESCEGPFAGQVVFACPVCSPPAVRAAYGIEG